MSSTPEQNHAGAGDDRGGEQRDERAVAAGESDAVFSEPHGDLSLRLGRLQVDVWSRWEAAGILNDIGIGLWFVAGSILNFFTDLETLGLVLYLVGSVQLLIRPFLKLAHRVTMRRLRTRSRPRMYRPDIDADS
ncbi:YrhK family protein [Demequina sp. NBRC 110053]|uniref:YrhK family protein n=1 Tax=Demequina sp. NBRC 110053 TaxID=1570342 RepID=UPI0009FD249F|nr:YrhK family protein [Demequina sp. NBRC 110053]